MADSRKKQKEEKLELGPFFTMRYIPTPTRQNVHMDEQSINVIRKGDSLALNLGEDLKYWGARFVLIGIVDEDRKNIAIRALPSFNFVKDEKLRASYAKKIGDFFGIPPEKVLFPNHVVWTGSVHGDLIKAIHESEPDLIKPRSRIFGFSLIKNMNTYQWVDRSTYNTDVFFPNKLAVLHFAFDLDKDAEVKFDRFYHMTRCIPREFFDALIKIIVSIIADPAITLSDYDFCSGYKYQTDWQALRIKHRDNPDEANKDLQESAIRHLFVYLDEKDALLNRDHTEEMIMEGLKSAKFDRVPIDIDYVPPDRKDKERALDKAKRLKKEKLANFLLHYKLAAIYDKFIEAVKAKDISGAKSIATSDRDITLSLLYKHTLENAYQRIFFNGEAHGVNFYDGVYLLSEMAESKADKQSLFEITCDYFKEKMLTANLDCARQTMHFLKTIGSVADIQQYFKTKCSDAELAFISHAAEVFAAEKNKLNINQQNADDATLVHLIPFIDRAYRFDLYNAFAVQKADITIPDKQGQSPLVLILKKHQIVDAISLFKGYKIPGKLITELFDYALENKDEYLVLFFLQYSKLLDNNFAVDQAKMLDKILVFLENITNKATIKTIIQALLDEESMLGRKLLTMEYSSRLFDSTLVESFTEKLNAILVKCNQPSAAEEKKQPGPSGGTKTL